MMAHYIFGVNSVEKGRDKFCPGCKQLLPLGQMSHFLVGAEGYTDALTRLESIFMHRPYKNQRYHSRVRKIQFFGIFEFYDFTIEEPAEEEFIADLRGFFNEDLGPEIKEKNKGPLIKKVFNLDFWPFNISTYEQFKGDNKKEHFKKYMAWKFFAIAFFFLKFFGLKRPLYKQRSFLREELAQDGQVFLLQGFFIGKLSDRVEHGQEML